MSFVVGFRFEPRDSLILYSATVWRSKENMGAESVSVRRDWILVLCIRSRNASLDRCLAPENALFRIVLEAKMAAFVAIEFGFLETTL